MVLMLTLVCSLFCFVRVMRDTGTGSSEKFIEAYRAARAMSPSRTNTQAASALRRSHSPAFRVSTAVSSSDESGVHNYAELRERFKLVLPHMDKTRAINNNSSWKTNGFKLSLNQREKRLPELQKMGEALELNRIVLPSEICSFIASTCEAGSKAHSGYQAAKSQIKPTGDDQDAFEKVILVFFSKTIPQAAELARHERDNVKKIQWNFGASDDAAAAEQF